MRHKEIQFGLGVMLILAAHAVVDLATAVIAFTGGFLIGNALKHIWHK